MRGSTIAILAVMAISSMLLPAYAEIDSILVTFDKDEYNTGDSITISGIVDELKMPEIAVSIFDPEGKILSANSVELDELGTFSKTFELAVPFYEKSGTYKVKLNYGSISQEETFKVSNKEITDSIIDIEIPEIIILFTDKPKYTDLDTITISGIATTSDSSVLIGIYDPLGNPAGFYFSDVDSEMEFSVSFLAKAGVNFKTDGKYSVTAHYGESEETVHFDFYKDLPDPETDTDDTTDTDTTDTTNTDANDTPDTETDQTTDEQVIIKNPTPAETETEKPKDDKQVLVTSKEKKQNDNLSVEDIELGIMLNQINLSCDSSKYVDSISYYDGMGPALYRLCKFESALAAFNDSLINDPANVEILTNKGSALAKLGHMQEAITFYDSALAIDAKYVPALNNKANALAYLGKYEQAVSTYEKALEINQNYVTAQKNLGLVKKELPDATTAPVINIADNQTEKKLEDTKSQTLEKKSEKKSGFLDGLGSVFSSLGNLFGVFS